MKNFILFLGLIFGSWGIAQSSYAQVIPVNMTFSTDSVIRPFTGQDTVYSIKLSGSVTLLSDSSLLRVVVIDKFGNHFLLYEAYPLIVHSGTITVDDLCDETCILNGIIPDSLRIDVISAIATLDELTIDRLPKQNIPELQNQSMLSNDSVKIEIMNEQILKYGMDWRAGRTNVRKLSFGEMERQFGYKFNLSGFDYYTAGVFERVYHRNYTPSVSAYVPSFDWRYRHGATTQSSPYFDGDTHNTINRSGWLTEVRDQSLGGTSSCGSCWDFTALGAVEARLNIYYNQHNPITHRHYDIDLSEQDILSCNSIGTCIGGDYCMVSLWL